MKLLKIKFAFLFVFFSLSGTNQDDGYQQNIESQITEQVDNSDKQSLSEKVADQLEVSSNQKDSIFTRDNLTQILMWIIIRLACIDIGMYLSLQGLSAMVKQKHSQEVADFLFESKKLNDRAQLDDLLGQLRKLNKMRSDDIGPDVSNLEKEYNRIYDIYFQKFNRI